MNRVKETAIRYPDSQKLRQDDRSEANAFQWVVPRSMTYGYFRYLAKVLARNGLSATLQALVDAYPAFRERAREEWVGLGRMKWCRLCSEPLDFFGGVGSNEDASWVVVCSMCKMLYEES